MTEEYKYKIKEEKDIDFDKLIEKYEEIQMLDAKIPGLSDIEFIKKTLQLCYEFLNILGNIEFLCEKINNFPRMKGIIDELERIAPEQVSEFVLTPEKIKDQFFNLDGKKECEIYANCMQLSNVIAHIIGEQAWLRKKLEEKNFYLPMALFFDIKDECIDRLIDAKNIYDDNTVFIEITKDSDNKDVIRIVLQNYIEPFSVHLKQEYSSYLINRLNRDGKVGFEYSTNNGEVFSKIPLFPIKLSNKASELTKLLYDNREDMIKDSAETIEWYRHISERFKSIDEEKNALKSKTKKEKTKRGGNSSMKKSKDTNNVDANREFWKIVNEQSNGILNPKIMESIITNSSSYSYMKIYKNLKNKIQEKIKDSEQIDNDDTFRQVFICMRLTGSFSKIANGTMSKAEQEIWIEKAIANHKKVFEYLELHRNDIDIGIKTMSKALEKYIETNGEVDLLKEKEAKEKKRDTGRKQKQKKLEEAENSEVVEKIEPEKIEPEESEPEKIEPEESEPEEIEPEEIEPEESEINREEIAEEIDRIVDQLDELKNYSSEDMYGFAQQLVRILERVNAIKEISKRALSRNNKKIDEANKTLETLNKKLEEARKAEEEARKVREEAEEEVRKAKEVVEALEKEESGHKDNIEMIGEIEGDVKTKVKDYAFKW